MLCLPKASPPNSINHWPVGPARTLPFKIVPSNTPTFVPDTERPATLTVVSGVAPPLGTSPLESLIETIMGMGALDLDVDMSVTPFRGFGLTE